MTDGSGFPRGLRQSAVPRWSHRDPVEGGNPFSNGDPRHTTWEAETVRARRALQAMDARLGQEPDTIDVVHYRERVLALAEGRFDIWAARCLTIVDTDEGARDFERWLADYVRNWTVYVRDTFPRLDFGGAVGERLGRRAAHWGEQAREV